MAELWNPKTRAVENVPDEQVNAKFDQGYTLPSDTVHQTDQGPVVNVVNPDTGEATSHPYADLREALAMGLRLESSEEGRARSVREKYGDMEVRAAALGAGKALTFGAVVPLLTQSGIAEKKTLAGIEEANPAITTGSEIGATILSMAVPGLGEVKAAGVLGKAAKAASVLTAPVRGVSKAGRAVSAATTEALATRLALQEAKTLGRQVIAKGGGEAAGAMLEGAAYGLGHYVSEASLDRAELTPAAIVSSVGLGAMLGGVSGGVFGAGGVLGTRAIAAAGKKISGALGKEGWTGYFEGLAHESALKSLGATQATFQRLDREIGGPGIARISDRIGNTTIKEGQFKGRRVIESWDDVKDIAPKMQAAKKEAGQELGEFRKRVSEIAEGDPETAPKFSEFFNRLTTDVINPLKKSVSRDQRRLASKVENLVAGMVEDAQRPLILKQKIQARAASVGEKISNLDGRIGQTETKIAELVNKSKKIEASAKPDPKKIGELNAKIDALEQSRIDLVAERETHVARWQKLSTKAEALPDEAPVTLDYLQNKAQEIQKIIWDPKKASVGVVTASAGDAERVAARRVLADYIEEATERVVKKRMPEEVGRYAELKAQYEAMSKGSNIVSHGIRRQVGNRYISPSDYAGGALGFGAGIASSLTQDQGEFDTSLLTGAAMAAGGALGHKMLRERGRATVMILAQKAAHLGALAKATRGATGRLEEIAKNIAAGKSGGSRPLVSQAATKAFVALGMPEGERQTAAARTRDRAEFVAKLATDPVALNANIGGKLGQLREIAPGIADQMTMKAVSTVSFLAEKAPKRPILPGDLQPMASKWEPSPREIESFERYAAAAHDPMGVIEDVYSGRVTLEGVETLKTLYPELYDEARTKMMAEVGAMDKPLPHGRLLDLGIFLGIPTHPSFTPQYLAMVAQSSANVPRETPPPSGGGPVKSFKDPRALLSGADSREFGK